MAQFYSTMKRLILILASIVALACSLRVPIIDGTVADQHEFPYQVSMQWNFNNGSLPRHLCSGSILNSRWILTAAHCWNKLSSGGWFEVVAGVNNIAHEERHSQRRNVTRFVQHPRYDFTSIKNDIAVMLLSHPLGLNKNIRTMELARNDTVVRQYMGKFAGWGSISKTFTDVFPDELMKVDLRLRSLKDCRVTWSVDSSQICAGGYQNGTGCTADSGGPLTVDMLNRRVQIGVLSYAEKPCRGRAPAVFSSVLYHYDWIQKAIGN